MIHATGIESEARMKNGKHVEKIAHITRWNAFCETVTLFFFGMHSGKKLCAFFVAIRIWAIVLAKVIYLSKYCFRHVFVYGKLVVCECRT